jgi:hypothetical protein
MNIDYQTIGAKVRESFDFEVMKLPLSGADNHYTPWYGLFRDDTGDYVGSGSISDRYVPHTTDDVCALVEAAANIFDGEVSLKTHFNDGHYVSVAPTDDHRVSVMGTADNVSPRIFISAGLDKEAFVATIGTFRDLCANLQMMRTVEGTSVSIRHTRSLRPKMDDLIATFSRLGDSWTTLTDVINHMESREVALAGFLDSIYGDVPQEEGRARTMHKTRTEDIFRRVQRERWQSGRPTLGSDFRVSAWEAYNAVQGHAQHDAIRRTRKGKAITAYDRVLLASKDRYVLAAEKLAIAA